MTRCQKLHLIPDWKAGTLNLFCLSAQILQNRSFICVWPINLMLKKLDQVACWVFPFINDLNFAQLAKFPFPILGLDQRFGRQRQMFRVHRRDLSQSESHGIEAVSVSSWFQPPPKGCCYLLHVTSIFFLFLEINPISIAWNDKIVSYPYISDPSTFQKHSKTWSNIFFSPQQ